MICDVIATIIADALNDIVNIILAKVRHVQLISYHLSTMATAPAFSSFRASVDKVTCAVTQQPAFQNYFDASNSIIVLLTKQQELQFVCQGRSIDLNVSDEDEEVADNHQDDLPAGVEAGYRDAFEVPDDDAAAAMEHCAQYQQDAGHQEHVFVAI